MISQGPWCIVHAQGIAPCTSSHSWGFFIPCSEWTWEKQAEYGIMDLKHLEKLQKEAGHVAFVSSCIY